MEGSVIGLKHLNGNLKIFSSFSGSEIDKLFVFQEKLVKKCPRLSNSSHEP